MNRFARTLMAAGCTLMALPLTPLSAQPQTPAAPVKQPAAASIIITNAPTGAENGKVRLNAPYLSAGISDIVRMFQAGVDEPVILAFIESSTVAYHPSAREVIYLRDLGLPKTLLTAMLKRGGELRDRAAEEERIRALQPAPPAEPSARAPAAAPAAQQSTVVYSTPTYVANVASTPAYVSYPRYSYAAYSYPAYNAYAYPAYGRCSPYYNGYYNGYYNNGYYGGPSFGFSYGSCGPRFSVGFGYGGYYGYRGSQCYSGARYSGGYAYRGHSGIRYTGSYGGHSGIRYAGTYGRHR